MRSASSDSYNRNGNRCGPTAADVRECAREQAEREAKAAREGPYTEYVCRTQGHHAQEPDDVSADGGELPA